MTHHELLRRITLVTPGDPGSALIRGTSITVIEVLGRLAAGEATEELLRRYPQLTEDDLHACAAYATEIALLSAVPSTEESGFTPPTGTRLRLIAETLRFVRGVIAADGGSPLEGVMRIALIGSLTTTKPDPKDIDLLITVGDGMELAPLASRARRLHEVAQSVHRGADLFLTNREGGYIGRICRQIDCGHGVRINCRALHCGRRPFLYDDLHLVRLSARLIEQPPIILWPNLIVRVPVPNDLQTGLIAPLQQLLGNWK